MRKILTILSLITAVTVMAQQAYTVETVPNPKNFGGGYVSNPDGLISAQVVPLIDSLCAQLERETSVQMAVVAVGSVGNIPHEAFSIKLANYWGIGHKDKNNGILMFWVADQRKVRIDVGRGMEQFLTDYDCGEILDNEVIPQFKKECYGAGLYYGCKEIQRRLTLPEVRAELLTEYHKQTEPEWVGYVCWYITIMMLVLIMFCFFSYRNIGRREGENNDKAVERAKTLVGWMTAFTVLFPFLYGLRHWANNRKKAIRKQPFNCDKCGHEMRLLSEEEEDAYLLPNQLAEEKVKSIDHDVWLCPECGNTRIYSYRVNNDYTKCSACGAVTLKLTSDYTVTHATEYSTGQGCKLFTCANCGHVHKTYYTIPRITRSSSSSSGGGGGGGGSSWGGGSFGGGGASRGY